MKKNIEVILDTKPSGGCGCNCGCDGATEIEDMNGLIEELKQYNFSTELAIDVLPISDFESSALVVKINALLDNTNASFRLTEENKDETLSDLLPIIVLDGSILTAYGVPTLNDVVTEVEKNI